MFLPPAAAAAQPDLRAFDPDKKDALTLPYRNRSVLFLGDGNFTCSHGVCSAEDSLYDPYDGAHHPFSTYVVTTEFKPAEECFLRDGTKERVRELNKSGALSCFNIDAGRLQEHFPENKFKIIFFNCPDVAASLDGNAELVQRFFRSASLVQEEGARICMTLMQPSESPEAPIFYQSRKYNIVQASQQNGYTLLKMRTPFAYQHQKTEKFRKHDDALDLVEFVFRKGIGLGDPDEWVSDGEYLHKDTKESVKARFFTYPISNEEQSYFEELKQTSGEIFAIRTEKERTAQAEVTEESSSDESLF